MTPHDKGQGLKRYTTIREGTLMDEDNEAVRRVETFYLASDIDARDAAALEGLSEGEREALDYIGGYRLRNVFKPSGFTCYERQAHVILDLARRLASRATPAEVVGDACQHCGYSLLNHDRPWPGSPLFCRGSTGTHYTAPAHPNKESKE